MPKPYRKNPRKITQKQLENLESTLAELGDLSGIVHDMVFIYALRLRSTGEIFYIGKTTNLVKRAGQHRDKAKIGTQTHLYNFMRKVWANGDDWDIHCLVTTNSQEWQRYEIAAIEEARRIGINLRNTTAGGIAPEMGEETRAKLSKALMGKKLSAEHRAKLSKAKIGKSPWNKGIETGRPSPMSNEQTRAKVSEKLKGRKFTPEWLEKMSIAKLGKEPANKGKTGLQGKPIEQLDLQTGEVLSVFPNGTLALQAVGGKSRGSLSQAANGTQRSAYGYGWRYVDLDERTS